MKLLIAIPALNEEQSIESIIQRSLAARRQILSETGVTEVEITVVSDGSTDRTAELAARYTGGADGIHLIVFDKNRGYGAAIKEAWAQSDAELLGFLDADGTCDPRFFATLCGVMERERADVALGCRMNRHSHMPWLRRCGNQLFAWLLWLLSATHVRDTASGMRVVRRSALSRLEPLPDGLHFTPAMSARGLLDSSLKIVEADMPYEERAGESKLRPGRDGLRFLRVIVDTALLYRPDRLLALAASACAGLTFALMLPPTLYYLTHGAVLEWMIYRFVVGHLVGIAACLLFAASYLTGRMAEISLKAIRGRGVGPVRGAIRSRWFWSLPAALLLGGGWLVLPSLISLFRTGATYEHWSRFIAMSFLYSVAILLLVTRACEYVLDLLHHRLIYLESRSHGMPVATALKERLRL